MTVKELIDHLQTLDPELRIFTKGYESGFDDIIVEPTTSHFVLNEQTEWYYGPHTRVKEVSQSTVPAIVIRACETNSNCIFY